jgi:hypothetical protein
MDEEPEAGPSTRPFSLDEVMEDMSRTFDTRARRLQKAYDQRVVLPRLAVRAPHFKCSWKAAQKKREHEMLVNPVIYYNNCLKVKKLLEERLMSAWEDVERVVRELETIKKYIGSEYWVKDKKMRKKSERDLGREKAKDADANSQAK